MLTFLTLLALAMGFQPSGNSPIVFTDCSASGSSAQSLTANTSYLLSVAGEDTFICVAASGSTCSSGGHKYAQGTTIMYKTGATNLSISCRSAGAAGDVSFNPGEMRP